MSVCYDYCIKKMTFSYMAEKIHKKKTFEYFILKPQKNSPTNFSTMCVNPYKSIMK